MNLFTVGRLVGTPAALSAVPAQEIEDAIHKHLAGDWGVVDKEDWQANQDALRDGTRLLSVYIAANGTRFWIITEADRSVTTVLLPDDY